MSATMRAQDLTVGAVILPPPRELRLWMRRTLAEKGLAESALYLTVTDVHEGAPDKTGRWLVVTASQTPEWIGNGRVIPFRFKVRPETPWAVIRAAHA